VQECLTNIHRHSDSKNAEIRLGISDGIISVTVRDNGKGMSVERPIERVRRWDSRNARTRRQLGGEISIESDASGTTVLASLAAPMPSPQKDQSN